MSLAQQHHALVTGGSSGIGAAIARRLREDGFGVVVLDRAEPDHAAFDRFLQVDLSNHDSIAPALAEGCADLTVTRLINNAGIVEPAEVEKTSLESLNRVLSVNLVGSIACVQAVLPGMRKAGIGRIVNISSRVVLGKELRTAYAASKAGLHGVTKTWALELARHGITVNAVGPGPIRTTLFDAANPAGDPRTQAIVDRVPVGFMGTPDDVADAVSFFASDRAKFVTGQILYVCGGMSIGSA